MSNLSQFVGRHSPKPGSQPNDVKASANLSQHKTDSRQAAQALKVKLGKPTYNAVGTAHTLSSTAPNPNTTQQYPGVAATRNTFPFPRYEHTRSFDTAETKGGFQDSEVESDFDHTITSGISFYEERESQGEEIDDQFDVEQRTAQDLPIHGYKEDGFYSQSRKQQPLEHPRSQSATGTAEADQNDYPGDKKSHTGISGRFHPNSQTHSSNNQPQSDYNSAMDQQHLNGSKKRGRQDEHFHEHQGSLPRHWADGEEIVSGGTHAARDTQKAIPDGSETYKESSDDENYSDESPSRQHDQAMKGLSQTNARNGNAAQITPVVEPEIDDDSLRRMSFAALRGQPFEHGPSPPKSTIPAKLKTATMAEKMEHVLTWDNQDHIVDIFKEFSIDEWEQAGDWFLERFVEILQKFKAARKNKREKAAGFEKELEKYEGDIQRKITGIDKLLDGMHAGAQNLLSPSKSPSKS